MLKGVREVTAWGTEVFKNIFVMCYMMMDLLALLFPMKEEQDKKIEGCLSEFKAPNMPC